MYGERQNIYLSLFVLFFLSLGGGTVEAAVPQTINYQGYLTTAAGQPVNGPVAIVFSLYDADTGGTALWTETHENVDIAGGVYSVILGNGNPVPVPIALPFDKQYYLGVKVGNDAEMTSRQALTSVPYAFRALSVTSGSITADNIAQGSITLDKLADVCATGEVLKKTSSGWVCGAPPCIPNDFVNCYSGPANTLNIGSCKAGIRRCSDQGSFGLCEGEGPPSTEICDGLDNDCDGTVDNNVQGAPIWYGDVDVDGFGDANSSVAGCTQPDGYVDNNRDCNDTLSSVFQKTAVDPITIVGGIEICGDGVDNDCDGMTDDGSCLSAACNAQEIAMFNGCMSQCNGDPTCNGGCISGSLGCKNAIFNTGICLSLNNCLIGASVSSGCANANCLTQWETAFGAIPAACTSGDTRACGSNVGACSLGTETCVNGNWSGLCVGAVNPVPEICGNGIDDDCNGVVDDTREWYEDWDGDTYGDPEVSVFECAQPVGFVSNAHDCDDLDAAVNPGAVEICDGKDNNCNGQIDEGDPGGGASCATGLLGICAAGTVTCTSGALVCSQNQLPTPEVCDGLDNNCDGQIDEGCGSSQDTAGQTCKGILITSPYSPDGIYWIDPDGGAKDNAFLVRCDMTRDGGGWTLWANFYTFDAASVSSLIDYTSNHYMDEIRYAELYEVSSEFVARRGAAAFYLSKSEALNGNCHNMMSATPETVNNMLVYGHRETSSCDFSGDAAALGVDPSSLFAVFAGDAGMWHQASPTGQNLNFFFSAQLDNATRVQLWIR